MARHWLSWHGWSLTSELAAEWAPGCLCCHRGNRIMMLVMSTGVQQWWVIEVTTIWVRLHHFSNAICRPLSPNKPFTHHQEYHPWEGLVHPQCTSKSHVVAAFTSSTEIPHQRTQNSAQGSNINSQKFSLWKKLDLVLARHNFHSEFFHFAIGNALPFLKSNSSLTNHMCQQ